MSSSTAAAARWRREDGALLLLLLLLPLSFSGGEDRRWAVEKCRSEAAMPSVTRQMSGLVRERADCKGCRIIVVAANWCC